jgi:hypothetical protein
MRDHARGDVVEPGAQKRIDLPAICPFGGYSGRPGFGGESRPVSAGDGWIQGVSAMTLEQT